MLTALSHPKLRTSSTRNNTLHDLTLIVMNVARFVGTESFLGYSNGHKK